MASSTASRSSTVSTLGNTMPRRPRITTAARSSAPHAIVKAARLASGLIRTKAWPGRRSTYFRAPSRAAAFCRGGTASSRSRIAASRESPSALSSIFSTCAGTNRRLRESAIRSALALAESLDEETVTQPVVAHEQRVLAELRHDGPDDAGSRQDHVGPRALQADDAAPFVHRAAAIQLDLPIDLGSIDACSLHGVRVVAGQTEHDRGDVRDDAAHPDEGIGRARRIEPRQILCDRVERRAELLGGDHASETKALRVPDGADVQAEALVYHRPVSERELGAASARVEDHQRTIAETEAGAGGEIGQTALLFARDDLDPDTRSALDLGNERVAVSGRPQAHRANRRDRRDAVTLRFRGHTGNRRHRPFHGVPADLPCLRKPLPDPGHLSAVHDCPPHAVRILLADVELHRVRADVDDRVARHDGAFT